MHLSSAKPFGTGGGKNNSYHNHSYIKTTREIYVARLLHRFVTSRPNEAETPPRRYMTHSACPFGQLKCHPLSAGRMLHIELVTIRIIASSPTCVCIC